MIDEVGYLTYGSDAANVLFHVVNQRHLRKTTQGLHDEQTSQRVGGRSCMTRISRPPSWIVSSSVGALSASTDLPGEHVISTWRRYCPLP